MIPFSDVNLVAVVLATLANFAIGFAWFMPPVFGNKWMKAAKFTPDPNKTSMGMLMLFAFVATFVCTYALGLIMALYQPQSIQETLVIILLFWIAFIAPAHLNRVLWEQASMTLFWISGIEPLIAVAVAGLILYGLS